MKKSELRQIIKEELLNEAVTYDSKTGLLYLYEVPFTIEAVEGLKKLFIAYQGGNQFEVEVSIKDTVQGRKVNVSPQLAIQLYKASKKNKVASKKDFKNR